MRTSNILCAVMALSTWTTAAAQTPLDPGLASAADRIDALVAPHAEAGLFSGVVLVVRGDRVVSELAYGFAGLELRVPNGPDTRFGIGSITKPMTEVLVALLSRDGLIDPRAPVERYLPGFPRGPDGGAPTVAHLIAHRAGVPHRVTDPAEEAQPHSPADIVDRVRAAGLLFEPGSDDEYSSAGFTCLARIVEVVTGRPFDVVLADRIFRPAGMSGATGETGAVPMRGRALPHRLGSDGGEVIAKVGPYLHLGFLTGAGSVYATARDVLRFVRAVHTGVYGDDLARAALAGDPGSWRGWAGRTGGYEAWVDMLPAEELTLVMLTNLRSASSWQLHAAVRELLAGGDPDPIPLPPPPASRFEDPGDLAGTYGPAEIRLESGALFRGHNEFYPIAGERYYIPASGTMMRFRRDATGAVDALVSIRGGGDGNVLLKEAAR